jgi:cytochrome c
MKKLLLLLPVVALLVAFRPATTVVDPTIPADVQTLLNKYNCSTCHAVSRKLTGPMWTEIAAKGYSKKKIADLVKNPKPENWPGYPAMTAQKTIPKADLDKIAAWLVSIK